MIKKIFVGVLMAGVFGLLVLGAVNRTLAKSVERDPISLQNSLVEGNGGENNIISAVNSNDHLSNGGSHGSNMSSQSGSDSEDSKMLTNGAASENNPGRVDGQGNQTEGLPADGSGVGLASVDEWITQSGFVESVMSDLWVVTLSDGTAIEIEGRTLSYAIESGFSVEGGDELGLTGFLEDGKFEIGQIENLTTGEIAMVRDQNGRPFWAGGGR
jgi:hypothetical protein